MDLTYRLYHNLDRHREPGNVWGEFRPAHRLAFYYEGTTTAAHPSPDHVILDRTAWDLFQVHNRDSRPCGRMGPSLSVGDVIRFVLPGTGWTTITDGGLWATLTHDGDWKWIDRPAEIIEGTYRDWLASDVAAR